MEEILFERNILIAKLFSEGGISFEEQSRLNSINFQLDEIENERLGASLDLLDHAATEYQCFASDLSTFLTEVEQWQISRSTYL
jgi:hypothetical protein